MPIFTGLTSEEAAEIINKTGPNSIPEKNDSPFLKIIRKLVSPISIMLLVAAVLSLGIHKEFDGYFILFLLALNIAITLWQENKADSAIKKLNAHLSESIKVRRNGEWTSIDSRMIAEGDIIELTSGDIIPADGKIVETHNVSVNESAFTGESLPNEKSVGDAVFSGTFLTTGVAQIQITATGSHTSLGKTLFSVDRIRKQSLLEQDVLRISQFLTILSLFAVVILSIVFLLEKASIIELLTLDLSLLIAGIPISLPTVMTLIIEFGVLDLSKKNAIVRRISALEDLANVNLLLTDKTGTLTLNKIQVREVLPFGIFNSDDVLRYARIATIPQENDPIDLSISEEASLHQIHVSDWILSNYVPPDGTRKRGTVTARKGNNTVTVSMGAPQIIASLCDMDEVMKNLLASRVTTFATSGFRSIAVAIHKESDREEHMQLLGIIALSDTLRDDASEVISFLKNNGITVAMVTGDHRAIASEVANTLHLDDGNVVTKTQLDGMSIESIPENLFKTTGAFAEILPDDKYKLVMAAKKYFVVASNGDGINDLPAIKAANVGIAVKNATNAMKSAADIVLLTDGISVIKDAIVESRKIFARIYSYSVYRISESLRLIVSIAILGLFFKVYPLTPLQLILLALLNDVPIISLAWDKVRTATKPSSINVKKRFLTSSVLGMVGVVNSILLFLIMKYVLSLPWGVIQTVFFLKLTVSGHMLIYVARTSERWWKFLPSKQVVFATFITQLLATFFAFTGLFMPAALSWQLVILVWIWALFWMQMGELMKYIQQRVTLSRTK